MANNIKGITIEIDANPTPLNNALKQIDSKTRSLSSELKQINSQLKFDPHNAVLLQQKFDVLTKKVEETRNKLQTLKDAQEQVDQQFKEGKIPEEEYRAFQREIALTESQLKTFEQQTEDAKKDLDNLGHEADETGTDFKEMGTDAQNSSKKVGSGFNTTAINLSSFTNIVRNIGSVIQSAIQHAVNLGKKIAGIVNEYFETADEINTDARKYGIDTDTLQKWRYASELIDVSAETMGSSLGKLTRSLKQYQKGNEDTVGAFESLGVSVYNASGQFRKSEDIFYDVIDALGRVEDETQADILANQIFGRSFQELNPLIDAGSGAIKDLGQEAEDLGLIMSPEQLDNLNRAKDSLDSIKAQLGMALLPIVEKLSPVIEDITNWLSEQLARPEVQESLGKIGEALATIVEAVGGALKQLVESGQLEALIDALVDALPAIAEFVANTLPTLVEGLTNILGFFTDIGKPVDDFDKKIKTATKDTESFSNKGQLSAGLLKTAFTGGMPAIFKAVDENMKASGQDFDTFFKDATAQFGPLEGLANSTFALISGDVSGAFGLNGDAWTGITTFFGNVQTEFQNLPNRITSWLSGIGDAITRAFKNIRLPKLRWKEGNMNKFPPDLGHIEWYRKGGIFTSPSVIGVGEAGPEVVLPLDRLAGILRSVGVGQSGNVVINAPVQVVKELNDAELNRVGGRITDIVGRQFAKRTGGTL